MHVTLALDTATPYMVLALRWQIAGGGETRELERAERVERQHAELLPSAVAGLFAEAELPLLAGRIVVGTGPGSYTGVRVGASYALALARVWEAQLIGVSTLTALVDVAELGAASQDAAPQAAALDARKGSVYGAVYGAGWKELAAPAKHPYENFVLQAEALGAVLREDVTPSGLSLLWAADALGQPEPEQRLSYL